jgi:hypothetical protein
MKPNTGQPKAPESKPTQDEVAKKAYAIYLKEGRPQGRDVQNWLEAETDQDRGGGGRSSETLFLNREHQGGPGETHAWRLGLKMETQAALSYTQRFLCDSTTS